MALQKIDSLSRTIALTAVVFGAIALLFLCVGVGTPNWESDYTSTGGASYALANTANFFYTCSFTNGTYNNCTGRSNSLTNYPRYSSAVPWMVDYNLRLQNAAGLSIVGILFLVFGLIGTLVLIFIPLSTWFGLIPPVLLFLASLFMLAALAEGSRYLLYNDYAANLYQTGHLLTIVALFLSTLAAGRVHFFRMQEEQVVPAVPK